MPSLTMTSTIIAIITSPTALPARTSLEEQITTGRLRYPEVVEMQGREANLEDDERVERHPRRKRSLCREPAAPGDINRKAEHHVAGKAHEAAKQRLQTHHQIPGE